MSYCWVFPIEGMKHAQGTDSKEFFHTNLHRAKNQHCKACAKLIYLIQDSGESAFT